LKKILPSQSNSSIQQVKKKIQNIGLAILRKITKIRS